MGLYELVRSKPYKDFMAKLYGWGAAVGGGRLVCSLPL